MRPCFKILYSSPRAAGNALRHIAVHQASRGRSAPAAVHWCETCRAWHLTSKKPTGRRAREIQALAGL